MTVQPVRRLRTRPFRPIRGSGGRAPGFGKGRGWGKGPAAGANDRGAVILEFTGFLPTLLVVGLAVIQLGLVGYSFEQASSGARAAARAESQEAGTGGTAGTAAMSSWMKADVGVGGGEHVTATVTVDIPTLIPFVDTGWTATRTATMPRDE